jgi:tetratricopeptide (TPR) repeat protein
MENFLMNLKNKIIIKNLLQQEKYEEIIIKVDEILKEETDYYLYFLKAKALFNCNRFNESLEAIRISFSLASPNIELLLLAARIYFKLHYYKKAEEFYKHSLKIRPDNPETLASYAFLLFITGNLEKSQELLYKAKEKEEFNIYTMVVEAKISLYSYGKKAESLVLEKIFSHTTGNFYDSITSGLILRLNKNKTEAVRIFKNLKNRDTRNSELYLALITLTKVPLYFFFRKNTKKNTFYYIFLFFNITGIFLLILYKYFGFSIGIIFFGFISIASFIFIIHKITQLITSKHSY